MSRSVKQDYDKVRAQQARAQQADRISHGCTGAYSCASPAHIEGCFATDERPTK